MRKQKPSLTFLQAIDYYFGGIHELMKQSFPFTCIVCKSSTYPKTTTDNFGIEVIRSHAILSLNDCFKYIRKLHKETIAIK